MTFSRLKEQICASNNVKIKIRMKEYGSGMAVVVMMMMPKCHQQSCSMKPPPLVAGVLPLLLQ